MVKEKNRINAAGKGITDCMPIAQSASEKVDVMLNTFFNEKPIKVLTTQTNPEKVTYGGNLFEKWPEMP